MIGYIVIHGSKANPVSSKEIVKNCATNECTVRNAIFKARASGIPICATREGYWYAEGLADVQEQYNSLASRVDALLEAMKGLADYIERSKKNGLN